MNAYTGNSPHPMIATVFAEELAIHRLEFTDIWGYSSIVTGALNRLRGMIERTGKSERIVEAMLAQASTAIAELTMKALDAAEGDHLIDLLPPAITTAGDRLHLVRNVMALAISRYADVYPEVLAEEIERFADPEVARRAVAQALQHSDR